MKKLTHIVSILLFSTLLLQAQSFNNEISKDVKTPYLLGKINKDALSSDTYKEWFVKNYNAYPSKTNIINHKELSTYTIKAFIGTWCGDSKKEIPRFYKILEETDFNLDRFTLVALDRERAAYKQSPGGEEEGLNIHRVPTFIFYKDGKEVNRIVESPVTSLEEDIQNILQENYTPNYQSVAMVDDLLIKYGLPKFQKKLKKVSKKLKGISVKSSELNTYSSVLFFSERKSEAIAVAKLNILLYPEEYHPYLSLAHKLNRMDNKTEALLNYQKALELDPENEKIKGYINDLKTNSAKS
ncbi:MAG: hypothetical protein KUG68_09115 [Flavobacteriaceae bacterium]|nr:hypothetical protein [Flavobacteriaceae bacterium]